MICRKHFFDEDPLIPILPTEKSGEEAQQDQMIDERATSPLSSRIPKR